MTHTCIRCGHSGPESDFLVMPMYPFGVSQTCNKCLDPILRHARRRAPTLQQLRGGLARHGRTAR